MTEREKIYQTQIIGCGPAGIGTLVAADHEYALLAMLQAGVALVDRGGKATFGQGGLQNVQIQSNSGSADFYSAMREDGLFEPVLRGEHGRNLVKQQGRNVSLARDVAPFLGDIGHRSGKLVEASPRSKVYLQTPIIRVEQRQGENDTQPVYTSVTADGRRITSEQVVLATGAHEEPALVGNLADKLFLSHDVLTDEALEAIQAKLVRGNGKLAILGGSHSSFSAVQRLLETVGSDLNLQEGSITLLHRNPVRLFYPTTNAARADGYTFTNADVCQQTGRVHRFGGLRADAKLLFQRIQAGDEKRVTLKRVDSLQDGSDILRSSAAIIQGLGYKPNRLPIVTEQGFEIGPATRPSGEVFVDEHARLQDNDGQPIPRMYGIGLGYGMGTTSQLGGESSYQGGLDGVNFYQGIIGQTIVQEIFSRT